MSGLSDREKLIATYVDKKLAHDKGE